MALADAGMPAPDAAAGMAPDQDVGSIENALAAWRSVGGRHRQHQRTASAAVGEKLLDELLVQRCPLQVMHASSNCISEVLKGTPPVISAVLAAVVAE